MEIMKAEILARSLMDQHGLHGWDFRFDRATGRAGLCNHNRKIIQLSKPVTELYEESVVVDTILHEIAHALRGVTQGHHHDYRWRAIHKSIGGNGKTTLEANEALLELHKSKAKYRTTCENGHEYRAQRRLKQFGERYCTAGACGAQNRNKNTRVYLVWYEDTKYGPVRAHD